MTAVIVAAVLFSFSFLSEKASVNLNISDDDFVREGAAITKQVEVSQWSNLITISLFSDPSSGYEWELRELTDSNAIKMVSNEYFDSEMDEISGQEVWTFDVRKSGTSTISMEYSQPQTNGIKALRRFDVVVVAQ